MALSLSDTLHMVHRCWRLRFKSEAPSIKYVREAGFKGTTVIDIGANKGVFSIYMSRAAGPNGQLIAFEAQPELGEHLNDVKDSFGLDNMTLVNQGLSSEPGTLTMHRPEAGSGMASFEFEEGENLETIDIPVIRLDDYVAENDVSNVSFIKCDVEGHELPVFLGAEQLLRRDMPALLFECHISEAEDGKLFDYLTGLGYDGYFFHVEPKDHKSLFGKTRGRWEHFSEFANLSHVKPGIQHRNYVFVRKGTGP